MALSRCHFLYSLAWYLLSQSLLQIMAWFQPFNLLFCIMAIKKKREYENPTSFHFFLFFLFMNLFLFINRRRSSGWEGGIYEVNGKKGDILLFSTRKKGRRRRIDYDVIREGIKANDEWALDPSDSSRNGERKEGRPTKDDTKAKAAIKKRERELIYKILHYGWYDAQCALSRLTCYCILSFGWEYDRNLINAAMAY